jgi:hypothetical protein
MKQLEDNLLPQKKNERQKVLILHDLGGIGKTQLSIEFARENWQRYSSTFWLDGRSEDTVRRNIEAIAKRLPKGQVPEVSRSGNGEDLDRVVRDVLDWFSIKNNKAWLLIFDNVDRDYMTVRSEPDAYDITRYFPGADHGSILVTTRLPSLEQLGIGLKLMSADDTLARNMMISNLDGTLEGIYMIAR